MKAILPFSLIVLLCVQTAHAQERPLVQEPPPPNTRVATQSPTSPPPPSNRKPVWNVTWGVTHNGQSIDQGHDYVLDLRATDPDGDTLTYTAEHLPVGAIFEPAQFPYPAVFRWNPKREDIGMHDITFVVSDGTNTVPALLRANVRESSVAALAAKPAAEDPDWTTFLMPGFGATVIAPANSGTWGTFKGVGAEFLLAGWIHSNENRGPSHGRVYLNLEVLGSERVKGAALQIGLGVDLSVERNPKRDFLIPFYGIQFGALVHSAIENGAIAHATPLAGIHFYAKRNVFIAGSVGYMLPLSGQYFDELRAVRAGLTADLSFW